MFFYLVIKHRKQKTIQLLQQLQSELMSLDSLNQNIKLVTAGCVDDNIVVADDRCNSLNLLWSF
jgi:hypothetical protein